MSQNKPNQNSEYNEFVDIFTEIFNQDDFRNHSEQEYKTVVEDCQRVYNSINEEDIPTVIDAPDAKE